MDNLYRDFSRTLNEIDPNNANLQQQLQQQQQQQIPQQIPQQIGQQQQQQSQQPGAGYHQAQAAYHMAGVVPHAVYTQPHLMTSGGYTQAPPVLAPHPQSAHTTPTHMLHTGHLQVVTQPQPIVQQQIAQQQYESSPFPSSAHAVQQHARVLKQQQQQQQALKQQQQQQQQRQQQQQQHQQQQQQQQQQQKPQPGSQRGMASSSQSSVAGSAAVPQTATIATSQQQLMYGQLSQAAQIPQQHSPPMLSRRSTLQSQMADLKSKEIKSNLSPLAPVFVPRFANAYMMPAMSLQHPSHVTPQHLSQHHGLVPVTTVQQSTSSSSSMYHHSHHPVPQQQHRIAGQQQQQQQQQQPSAAAAAAAALVSQAAASVHQQMAAQAAAAAATTTAAASMSAGYGAVDLEPDQDYVALSELKDFIDTISSVPSEYENSIGYITDVLNQWMDEDPDIIQESIVNNIMDQSIMDTNFRYNGVRFCIYLSHHLKQVTTKTFKDVLLERCRREHKRARDLAKASDGGVYLRGLTFFIGDLCTKLVDDHQVLLQALPDLLGTLIAHKSTDNVKCVCQVLKLCGRTLDDHCRSASDDTMDHMVEQLKQIRDSPGVHSSVVNLVNMVLSLRDDNWNSAGSGASYQVPVHQSPSTPASAQYQMQGPNPYEQEYGFGPCGDDNNDEVCDAFEEFLRQSGQM